MPEPERWWILLLGASTFGMRALTQRNLPFGLIADPANILPAKGDHTKAIGLAVASLNDVPAVDLAASRLIAAHGKPGLIISFSESGQRLAARMSEANGTKTVGLGVVDRVMDKFATRDALADTEDEWPSMSGDSEAIVQWLQALGTDRLNAGWIIKPIAGAGSKDIAYVGNAAELSEWVNTTSAASTESRWITEQYAGGPEFSVEAVTSASGEHLIIGITEKVTSGSPHFVELAHVHPARITHEQTTQISQCVRRILTRLGLTLGPSHTEIKLDPRHGPVLIETHTRPGGDLIPELARLASGLDQYSMTIQALLGEPVSFETTTNDAAAIRFVHVEEPGLVQALHIELPPGSDVVERRFEVDLGSDVRQLRSSGDRVGYCLSVGLDSDNALLAAETGAKSMSIDVYTH